MSNQDLGNLGSILFFGGFFSLTMHAGLWHAYQDLGIRLPGPIGDFIAYYFTWLGEKKVYIVTAFSTIVAGVGIILQGGVVLGYVVLCIGVTIIALTYKKG